MALPWLRQFRRTRSTDSGRTYAAGRPGPVVGSRCPQRPVGCLRVVSGNSVWQRRAGRGYPAASQPDGCYAPAAVRGREIADRVASPGLFRRQGAAGRGAKRIKTIVTNRDSRCPVTSLPGIDARLLRLVGPELTSMVCTQNETPF